MVLSGLVLPAARLPFRFNRLPLALRIACLAISLASLMAGLSYSPGTALAHDLHKSLGPSCPATSLFTCPSGHVMGFPGFDNCSTPSATDMQAFWNDTVYWWTDIYMGGVNDPGCTQVNSSWVSAVMSQGWRLVPEWDGPAAPCSPDPNAAKMSWTPSTAFQQGKSDADAAISAAGNIGIGASTILYEDMEPFDSTNSACVAAVNQYANGWSTELHAATHPAGMYIDSNTGTADALALGQAAGSITEPDDVWISHGGIESSGYDANCTVWNNANLSNGFWKYDQRLYQYAYGVLLHETGTGTYYPDLNCADGDVVGAGVGDDDNDESNEGASSSSNPG